MEDPLEVQGPTVSVGLPGEVMRRAGRVAEEMETPAAHRGLAELSAPAAAQVVRLELAAAAAVRTGLCALLAPAPA